LQLSVAFSLGWNIYYRTDMRNNLAIKINLVPML